MSEFKEGDEVECIHNDYYPLTNGAKYKVLNVNCHGNLRICSDKGTCAYYSSWRFKHIESGWVMKPRELKVRIMPEFAGVARRMEGLFPPTECKDGELVVRKGKISFYSEYFNNSTEHNEPSEYVLAFAKDLGLIDGVRLIRKTKDGWKLDIGSTSCDNRILEAISGVIGEPSP
jgi:hypothetical protein